MNIYGVPAKCGLCGGDGMAPVGSLSWSRKKYKGETESDFFHKDPFVCKEVLRKKTAKEAEQAA